MSFLEAILLGLVQGATEFIPVSSSGHLILFREWLMPVSSVGASDLAVDAVLQLATSFSILVYFAKDIKKLLTDKVFIKAAILGTIPAVILGLLLEDYMETIFRSSTLVACTLLAGAALMYFAEKFSLGGKELSPKRGFMIGLFQAFALIPGMSRSGSTISGGLLLGLSREQAVRFSFLLALPILLGSGFKKLLDIYTADNVAGVGVELWVGVLVAFVSGLLAIHFLVSYLKNNKLTLFIWYRVALAIVILLFL